LPLAVAQANDTIKLQRHITLGYIDT